MLKHGNVYRNSGNNANVRTDRTRWAYFPAYCSVPTVRASCTSRGIRMPKGNRTAISFVEKIVVPEATAADGRMHGNLRRQEIEIYYSFAGRADLPE